MSCLEEGDVASHGQLSYTQETKQSNLYFKSFRECFPTKIPCSWTPRLSYLLLYCLFILVNICFTSALNAYVDVCVFTLAVTIDKSLSADCCCVQLERARLWNLLMEQQPRRNGEKIHNGGKLQRPAAILFHGGGWSGSTPPNKGPTG